MSAVAVFIRLARKQYAIARILAIGILVPISAFADAGNQKIDSFSKAKRILRQYIYADRRVTFYCGCPFSEGLRILPNEQYASPKSNKRAARVEWEHIVPAHAFGQSFVEWRNGHPKCMDRKGRLFKGRNCARKMSRQYRYMEADLYNLVPAVGELNGLRSNYSFAVIPGEKRVFGKCDFEIENRKAEPAPHIRGDIARTYFYMDRAYPGHGIISQKNRKLFEAWDREDPVDEWECERCRRIERIQGNTNQILKERCRPIEKE